MSKNNSLFQQDGGDEDLENRVHQESTDHLENPQNLENRENRMKSAGTTNTTQIAELLVH